MGDKEGHVKEGHQNIAERALVSSGPPAQISRFYSLPGKRIVDQILEMENPRELIQKLPHTDFVWLVRKVGEEESLPLLAMASENQWQHLLDLEMWIKDRLDETDLNHWIERLELANPGKLVGWLFGDAQALCFMYLFKNVLVEINEGNEDYVSKDGFFSLDGMFYVKVFDESNRAHVERLLGKMAVEDPEKYHSLLLNLAGIMPSELE